MGFEKHYVQSRALYSYRKDTLLPAALLAWSARFPLAQFIMPSAKARG